MRLLKNKKGKISSATVNTLILAIILLVILFQVYAEIVPEAQTGGNSLNASNQCTDVYGCSYNASIPLCETTAASGTPCGAGAIPLAGLFSGTGVVFVIIMAALIILVVKAFMKDIK